MITKQEIMECAKEFSLRADIVEKDYVLGWVLAGIASQPELIDKLVFKGGTCLKKCYFETYRFSEDLDYTVTDGKYIDEKILEDYFKKIALWVNAASGIEIPVQSIQFEKYQNNTGKESIEGRIGYIGPLQRRNSLARIKLDLTADELLVLATEQREIHHPYSDKPREGMKANCYTFSEIFAEKIRALSERARPRDLYDVIHMYRHTRPNFDVDEILKILQRKCAYKVIPVPTMALLESHPKRQELEAGWESMLSHQLPMLPSSQQFWQELSMLFQWLQGEVNINTLEPMRIRDQNIDQSWHPPGMIQAWHKHIPLELIRYAGANHLCVELIYDDAKHLIEPYDLKRAQDGSLLIIALRVDSNEWFSYQVEQIQQIEVSKISFVPRAAIMLTPFLGGDLRRH